MSQIIFKTKKDAIHVDKDNGTSVDYYLFDEFEIHQNIIQPHTLQEWHYHQKIKEIIVVNKGTLLCHYLENNIPKKRLLNPQEIVCVENSIHTFENNTSLPVEFTVFRFVAKNKNLQEIIKKDKVVVKI